MPQLAMPSLAGAAGEAVDAAALAFLLSQSLAAMEHEDRKKREEEAKEALKAWKVRRKRVRDEFMALIDTPTLTPLEEKRLQELVAIAEAMDASKPGSSSASSSTRRKKKKRGSGEEYGVRGLASPHTILCAILVLSVARGVLWISGRRLLVSSRFRFAWFDSGSMFGVPLVV